MSKMNLAIEIKEEKLKALEYYCEKRQVNLEKQIDEFVQKIYVKYVPKEIREYIENLEKEKRKREGKRDENADKEGIE